MGHGAVSGGRVGASEGTGNAARSRMINLPRSSGLGLFPCFYTQSRQGLTCSAWAVAVLDEMAGPLSEGRAKGRSRAQDAVCPHPAQGSPSLRWMGPQPGRSTEGSRAAGRGGGSCLAPAADLSRGHATRLPGRPGGAALPLQGRSVVTRMQIPPPGTISQSGVACLFYFFKKRTPHGPSLQ